MENGRRVLCVTTPRQFDFNTSGVTTVRNWGSDYMREQAAIKRRIEQQKRAEQAATAAGASATADGSGSGSGSGSEAGSPAVLPQPDSPDVVQAKWQVLRDKSVAELNNALAAMLRQALRFRGRVEFPIAEHFF